MANELSTVGAVVIIIFSFLGLPYLFNLINRPSILCCGYLFLGVAVGSFLKVDTRFMIDEIGKIGFILTLFIVGLEIDLPPFGTLRKSFRFVLSWLLIQMPLFGILSYYLGYGVGPGLVAGAGVNACSLGISYRVLESQKEALDEGSRKKLLLSMVVLEIFALFILATSEVVYTHGWSKEVLYHSSALIGFILLIRTFSGVIYRQLSRLIEEAGRWKIHQILLILFSITIIGDKFGLSAPKTAFFLGLFMSSTTHKGIKFEDELRPLAQNILIPIFFISLGSKILVSNLFPYIFPIALLITVALFFIRYCIFKLLEFEIPSKYFLLLCPNLTMVAVAAGILMEHQTEKSIIDLLLATGFLMSIASAFLLPVPKAGVTQIKVHQS